jgi:hypothetical protein
MENDSSPYMNNPEWPDGLLCQNAGTLNRHLSYITGKEEELCIAAFVVSL